MQKTGFAYSTADVDSQPDIVLVLAISENTGNLFAEAIERAARGSMPSFASLTEDLCFVMHAWRLNSEKRFKSTKANEKDFFSKQPKN